MRREFDSRRDPFPGRKRGRGTAVEPQWNRSGTEPGGAADSVFIE